MTVYYFGNLWKVWKVDFSERVVSVSRKSDSSCFACGEMRLPVHLGTLHLEPGCGFRLPCKLGRASSIHASVEWVAFCYRLNRCVCARRGAALNTGSARMSSCHIARCVVVDIQMVCVVVPKQT